MMNAVANGALWWAFRDFYEVDNTPAQAKTIATSGRTQNHSIHRTTDVDWVKFQLTERSNVVLQTNGRSGDTEMWLFGPNSSSTQIAYDNDSGSGRFSRIERSGADALEPGTYYVKVGECGSDQTIFRYTIGVQATPAPLADGYESDDTWQQAAPIDVSQGPQTHTIHQPTDVDWVTFTLAAPADVVIETRGTSGDTQIALYGANPDVGLLEVDDNDGVGSFSVIVRSGAARALDAGTYYVKVEEAGLDSVVSNFTLSVTAVEKGDVLLVQGEGGVSKAIRVGEFRELGVAFENTFSHAAVYVGDGNVAEMVGEGFRVSPLDQLYAGSSRVDLLRHKQIGALGAAVADAALSYANTPYAFFQIGVFGAAVFYPNRPDRVVKSSVYPLYQARDAGPQRMICSELVARAFAQADPSLALDVTLWPTLAGIPDQTEDFRMDFTSPTMLSLSPDLRRLNA